MGCAIRSPTKSDYISKDLRLPPPCLLFRTAALQEAKSGDPSPRLRRRRRSRSRRRRHRSQTRKLPSIHCSRHRRSRKSGRDWTSSSLNLLGTTRKLTANPCRLLIYSLHVQHTILQRCLSVSVSDSSCERVAVLLPLPEARTVEMSWGKAKSLFAPFPPPPPSLCRQCTSHPPPRLPPQIVLTLSFSTRTSFRLHDTCRRGSRYYMPRNSVSRQKLGYKLRICKRFWFRSRPRGSFRAAQQPGNEFGNPNVEVKCSSSRWILLLRPIRGW